MAAASVALAAAGCVSPDDRGRGASDVAVRMFQAVDDRDGTTACGLLAPDIVAELEQSSGTPCAQAILGEDLPRPGPIAGTEVYGQRAQVRFSGDTVFLGAFGGGWQVVAAGCTAPEAPPSPYDCTVQGG